MIETGSSDFWRATLALSLGSFLVFANVHLVQPLLPLLAADFEVDALRAGAAVSVTMLALGVSLLVYGPLSDALGRRAIMLVSLTGATLVSLLLTQVQELQTLLWLRALQGVLLGGLPAIALAYFGDEFKRGAVVAAVGFYIGGNSLGGIGGRLIGGAAAQFGGWPMAFAVMAVVSLMLLLAFAWLLPPSRRFRRRPLRPARMLGDLAVHWRNPLLVVAFVFGGLNFLVFFNQYSYITFVLSDAPFHLTPLYLGLLFLTYLGGTFGSAVSGRVARRIPQPLCMALGVGVMMAGSLLTLVGGLAWIVLGFLVSAFGFFFAHANASSWVSRHARRARASASALYLLCYYLGASSGGLLLDPFWQHGRWGGVVAGGLLVLSATLALALGLHGLKRRARRSRAGQTESGSPIGADVAGTQAAGGELRPLGTA